MTNENASENVAYNQGYANPDQQSSSPLAQIYINLWH